MITLYHVHYEIHDEVRKNDKVHNSFIKFDAEKLSKISLLIRFSTFPPYQPLLNFLIFPHPFPIPSFSFPHNFHSPFK